MFDMNGKVKRVALAVFFSAFFALAIVGQGQSKAYKVTEFDPKVENEESFDGKAALFIRLLGESEKGTLGYVNLYDTDSQALRLIGLLSKVPDPKGRLLFFEPGRKYVHKDKSSIERVIAFWLVPDGAEPPYQPTCALCDCPDLSISGEEYLFTGSIPKEKIAFRANVVGGFDVTYVWTIVNGTILNGQGTSAIEVKPSVGWNKEVSATLEIGGLNPNCNCKTTDSFTTSIRPD